MIKGKRVLLRPVKKEDIPIQHKFHQNYKLAVLSASQPHVTPIESTEEWYQFCIKKSKEQILAIEIDGAYVGHCSIRDSESYPGNYWYGIEIGDPEQWGKGYGSEVTNLVVDFAFHYLGARRIGLGTNSANERAINCFKSGGFVEEGRIRKHFWVDGNYADYVYMGILREEWENSNKRTTKCSRTALGF
jgi:RimJ/RimL family protein N-acetyltransferase